MKAVSKGFIKNTKTGEIRNFVFNPSNFSDDISVTFNELGSGGAVRNKHQFITGSNRSIELNLFIRSKDSSKIEEFKNFLEDFLPLTRFVAPPPLLFCFGTYIKKCMLLNVKRNWNDFNEDLQVTEMSLKLSLKEV